MSHLCALLSVSSFFFYSEYAIIQTHLPFVWSKTLLAEIRVKKQNQNRRRMSAIQVRKWESNERKKKCLRSYKIANNARMSRQKSAAKCCWSDAQHVFAQQRRRRRKKEKKNISFDFQTDRGPIEQSFSIELRCLIMANHGIVQLKSNANATAQICENEKRQFD